jgi:hypothetical protein
LAQQSAAASEELKAQAEQVRLGVSELMRMARGGASDAPEKTKAAPSNDRVVTPRVSRSRGNGSNGTSQSNSFHSSHAPKATNAKDKNSNAAESSNGHAESNGSNGSSASNGNGSHVVSDLAIARGSSDDLSFEDHR